MTTNGPDARGDADVRLAKDEARRGGELRAREVDLLRFQIAEIDAYADAMAAMFCAYVRHLAKNDVQPLP